MKIGYYIYDSSNNPFLNGGGAVRAETMAKLSRHSVDIITCKWFSNYLLSRIHFILKARSYNNCYSYDLTIEDYSCFSPLGINADINIVQAYWTKKQLFKKLSFVGIIVYWMQNKYIRNMRNVVTVSKKTAEIIKLIRPGKPVKIIYNGIDTHLTDLGLQRYFHTYLGRLEWYEKGLDRFFEYVREHPENLYIIAGDGKDKKNVIAQCKKYKNVKYVGRVNSQEKCTLLNMSKAVILLSRNESFGLVAVEAMKCGCDVMYSDEYKEAIEVGKECDWNKSTNEMDSFYERIFNERNKET